MATLSTSSSVPAALEIESESVLHGDLGLPTQARLQLFVAVTRALPVGVPSPAIEYRWQLSLRPVRIPFPHPTQQVTYNVRHVDRPEALYILFVQAQKLPAGRKIVVHDVKN